METASHGHQDIVEWLYSNANGSADVLVAYEAAIANNHKPIGYFLALISGASANQIDTDEATRRGRFPLLECLVQHGPNPVHLSGKPGLNTGRNGYNE